MCKNNLHADNSKMSSFKVLKEPWSPEQKLFSFPLLEYKLLKKEKESVLYENQAFKIVATKQLWLLWEMLLSKKQIKGAIAFSSGIILNLDSVRGMLWVL